MDLNFTEDDKKFQKEVRDFIAESYPYSRYEKKKARSDLEKEDFLAWHRILHKKGWVAPGWPVEYGGTGWTATQKYIWNEENGAAGTVGTLPFGLQMVAPVIYTFGSDEQKKKFLPRILSGEDWWCQGYSEPGSGSDLASLKNQSYS